MSHLPLKSGLLIISALFIGAAAPKIEALEDRNGFIPHKALYEISLQSVRSGSQIVNVSGQMFYEWKPDCEAWNSSHRFNLYYEYADTSPMRITSDFSTFESFDGKKLDFVSQRKQDGDLFDEVRGAAQIDGATGGKAEYTKPKGLVYELPPGTMFPMEHSIHVAKAIKDDKKFTSAIIFDGSDDEGPVEVNAVIGKDVNTGDYIKADFTNADGLDLSMLESPAKDVRLAFFPMNDPASTPDYEMSLVMHENSVISGMTIEYDEFTINQKLVALEPVEGGCTTE